MNEEQLEDDMIGYESDNIVDNEGGDDVKLDISQEDCDADKDSIDYAVEAPMDNLEPISMKMEPKEAQSSDDIPQSQTIHQWNLPADKEVCTLEEIRRGQVINKTDPNECPVPGCGKKINEQRIDPSPGTISSGLRTHVLFVHYANRKGVKKRKLGWSKRRNPLSPRKPLGSMLAHSSPSTSRQDPENSSIANLSLSLNLINRGISPTKSSHPPGSILSKKVKQISAAKSQMSQKVPSLQSLMQVSSGATKSNGTNSSPLDAQNYNTTTSSLFSILAGLTQHQNMNQSPAQLSKNVRTAHGTNTINISPCPRNSTVGHDRSVNSSLLSLLNEEISGNVASSLQRAKHNTTNNHGLTSPINTSYYQTNNNDSSINNCSSILSSHCAGNADTRLNYKSSALYSFIESIANKTASNIGPAGIHEAERIIEKFTTSLICSSQTIADHYLAPFSGEVPQQKPEINPSDLVLAYKMMHKTHGQL